MVDVTIGNYEYQTGKLNTFDKLHVARKLAPLLSGFMAVQAQRTADLPTDTPNQPEAEAAAFGAMVGPIAEAVSRMSDEEVEQIIGRCLNVVKRKLPGDLGWTPIWNRQAKGLQFEDIDLPEMMRLTMAVLEDNIGSFLPANPAISRALGAGGPQT